MPDHQPPLNSQPPTPRSAQQHLKDVQEQVALDQALQEPLRLLDPAPLLHTLSDHRQPVGRALSRLILEEGRLVFPGTATRQQMQPGHLWQAALAVPTMSGWILLVSTDQKLSQVVRRSDTFRPFGAATNTPASTPVMPALLLETIPLSTAADLIDRARAVFRPNDPDLPFTLASNAWHALGQTRRHRAAALHWSSVPLSLAGIWGSVSLFHHVGPLAAPAGTFSLFLLGFLFFLLSGLLLVASLAVLCATLSGEQWTRPYATALTGAERQSARALIRTEQRNTAAALSDEQLAVLDPEQRGRVQALYQALMSEPGSDSSAWTLAWMLDIRSTFRETDVRADMLLMLWVKTFEDGLKERTERRTEAQDSAEAAMKTQGDDASSRY